MIKSHHELASFIAGQRILHLNSLGKDSIACLEWLANFASCEVVSVLFDRIAKHPDDDRYFDYLCTRYPNVRFIKEPNAWEMSELAIGTFQSPVRMLTELSAWEHYAFDYKDQAEAVRVEQACDFMCIGMSKYESVARATNFYRKGLVIDNTIFPIGLMTKAQVLSIVTNSGTKLHPCYKFTKGTFDKPSYYKMRMAFRAQPEYKATMFKMYPLLALDEYRYEVLLNGKTK